MGKIDDMRRLREQQFAETEKRRAAGAKAQPAPTPAPAPAPAPAPPTRTKRDDAEQQGKCPECGKMKPLQNGVMASHQKGFGKACAGTRKKPA